jgi:hypothetical protein
MDNSFQTSFIPKKPVVINSGTGRKINILMVVSVILLVIIALSSGIMFLYKGYLEKNKQELSASLLKTRDNFNKDTIAQLQLYDKRASVAKEILKNHIVLSPLLKLINDITLSSVQYTKFSHDTKDNVFSVKMSGVAPDYKSIALQADVFSTDKASMLKDVVFSNLVKTKTNDITFDVNFDVDPALLSYLNNLSSQDQAPNAELPVITNNTQ